MAEKVRKKFIVVVVFCIWFLCLVDKKITFSFTSLTFFTIFPALGTRLADEKTKKIWLGGTPYGEIGALHHPSPATLWVRRFHLSFLSFFGDIFLCISPKKQFGRINAGISFPDFQLFYDINIWSTCGSSGNLTFTEKKESCWQKLYCCSIISWRTIN